MAAPDCQRLAHLGSSLQPGIGMDSDRNAVTIITHHDVIEVPEASKREVAERILDVALRLRQEMKKKELTGI